MSAAPKASGPSKVDLKVVMLGDRNVGKTACLQRYISDTFVETQTTIGASFFLKNWRGLNVAIWDTAGEEKFRSISALYCRAAGGAVIAYDMTDKTTFASLDEHVELLRKGASPDCKIVVMATKMDLVRDGLKQRQVTEEEGRGYANRINAVSFLETSAKTAHNVSEVFERIALAVFKDRPEVTALSSSPAASPIQRTQPSQAPRPQSTIDLVPNDPGPAHGASGGKHSKCCQ